MQNFRLIFSILVFVLTQKWSYIRILVLFQVFQLPDIFNLLGVEISIN